MLQIKAPAKRPAPATIEKSRIAIISPDGQAPARHPGPGHRLDSPDRKRPGLAPTAPCSTTASAAKIWPCALSRPTKKWKKYTLYRRIPASGSIYVTLALTGLGNAYFDDVTIEPLVPAAGSNPNIINPVRFNGGTAP